MALYQRHGHAPLFLRGPLIPHHGSRDDEARDNRYIRCIESGYIPAGKLPASLVSPDSTLLQRLADANGQFPERKRLLEKIDVLIQDPMMGNDI